MKAVTRDRYGPPEVLDIRELPDPLPQQGELLVRVRATTVNRTDCANLLAKPFIMRFVVGLFRPKRQIPGTDFSGIVVAVGPGVTGFQPGDPVWGFNDTGLDSQADYMTVSTRRAVGPAPATLPPDEAVACIEGAHYAYHVLDKVRLKAGQKVLVNGASGAIGSAMVQMLKYHGLKVTAVCPTELVPRVKALGADRVIDFRTTDFTKDEDRYDYVFDAVGKSTFFKCRKLLRARGTYISSELGPWIQNLILSLITPFLAGRRVRFPVPLSARKSLSFITMLVNQGHFKPMIDRRYPLEQVRDAYSYVLSGQKAGNVLLVMEDEKRL